MLMYLNWNVNASEQECKVQHYNAVSGINIQYSSSLIDFGTVKNTRSTKEESHSSAKTTINKANYELINSCFSFWYNGNRKKNMEIGRLQIRLFLFPFGSQTSQVTKSMWVLGDLLWCWLIFTLSKISSAQFYLTSECWQVSCMSQEISLLKNWEQPFCVISKNDLWWSHAARRKTNKRPSTLKYSSQAAECWKKSNSREAHNKENEKESVLVWLT